MPGLGEQSSSALAASIPSKRQKIDTDDGRLQADLQALAHKNTQFLAPPARRERHFMSKLAWFFLFLLFIAMGGLFFLGGFLTCYTVFPPRPEGVIGLTALTHEESTPAIVSAYGQNGLSSDQFYASRRALLGTVHSATDPSLFLRAEELSREQTKQAAKSHIERTLDSWSQKIRASLGPILGTAIVPLTTGLARSVVDTSFGTQTDNKSSPPSLSQQSALSQQSVLPQQSAGPQDKPAVHGVTGKEKSSQPSQGRYTIQVQELNNSVEAIHLAQKLQSHHFGAYVVRLSTPSGLRFSVRVGVFNTFQDAHDAAILLREVSGQPARVLVLDRSESASLPESVR